MQEAARKEEKFQQELAESKRKMREQEERAQHNTEKKEAIMQLRKDLEPLIIEANEIAASIG